MIKPMIRLISVLTALVLLMLPVLGMAEAPLELNAPQGGAMLRLGFSAGAGFPGTLLQWLFPEDKAQRDQYAAGSEAAVWLLNHAVLTAQTDDQTAKLSVILSDKDLLNFTMRVDGTDYLLQSSLINGYGLRLHGGESAALAEKCIDDANQLWQNLGVMLQDYLINHARQEDNGDLVVMVEDDDLARLVDGVLLVLEEHPPVMNLLCEIFGTEQVAGFLHGLRVYNYQVAENNRYAMAFNLGAASSENGAIEITGWDGQNVRWQGSLQLQPGRIMLELTEYSAAETMVRQFAAVLYDGEDGSVCLQIGPENAPEKSLTLSLQLMGAEAIPQARPDTVILELNDEELLNKVVPELQKGAFRLQKDVLDAMPFSLMIKLMTLFR